MGRSKKRRRAAQRQVAAQGTSERNARAEQSTLREPVLPEGPQPIVVHQAHLHGIENDIPSEPGIGALMAARAPAVEMVEVPPVGAADRDVVVAEPDAAVPRDARRADSLDALRGLFLVMMTLGFSIQTGMFPDWMYHRQTPVGPVVDVAGISWRDIAYGAFLFTMAAAMPITLSRRMAKGDTELAIIGSALQRGFMLFAFALMIGHANTFFTGYTQTGRVIAIVGFAVMFMMFVRRRSDWNEQQFGIVRRAGWIAAILFLALSPLLYDETFSPARRDGVMATLAFAAVAGSTIWYLTRNNLNARLAVLGAVVALYLGARGDGWVQQWWWSSPVPWLFTPSVLGVLTIIIPGTIAGDAVLRWMNAADADEPDTRRWGTGRLSLLALIGLALTPLVVIGLYNRWVLETTQVALSLCLAGTILVLRPTYPGERLLRSLFVAGAIWLMMGLVLDPFESGIRKVPETLSYFFTITGLTTMLMVSLTAVVDLMRKRALVQPLIDVGQNPMLCYVLFTVLLNSVFEMIPPLRGVLRASPGESMLRSMLTVALVVVIVRAFTRQRIYWRT